MRLLVKMLHIATPHVDSFVDVNLCTQLDHIKTSVDEQ